jgi:FeS assembly protein IscX
MNWSDTYEIVDILCEKYPDKDPEKLLFIDLMNMVVSLEEFSEKKKAVTKEF